MTDEEIFDSLSVPADRREELRNWLHAWSRANPPGPNMYAITAAVFWNVLRMNTPVIEIPEDTFDPTAWLGEHYDPDHNGFLGTVRGWPWVGLDV